MIANTTMNSSLIAPHTVSAKYVHPDVAMPILPVLFDDILSCIFHQIIDFPSYLNFRVCSRRNLGLSRNGVYTIPPACSAKFSDDEFAAFMAPIKLVEHICITGCYGASQDYLKVLSNCRSVDIVFGTLSDVSALKHCHRVKISSMVLTDFSPLVNCHTVELAGTRITDAGIFANCHTVVLDDTGISDVSALGRCHTLKLANTKVADVSMLGNCHTLILDNTKVVDVSALEKCHTVSVNGTDVTDFSPLAKCHTVYVSHTVITDLTVLGKCRKIFVEYCDDRCSGIHSKYDRDMLRQIADVEVYGDFWYHPRGIEY